MNVERNGRQESDDDVELTGFALGQLDEQASNRVASQLVRDEHGTRQVREIQRLAGALQQSANHDLPDPIDGLRETLVEAFEKPSEVPDTKSDQMVRPKTAGGNSRTISLSTWAIAITLLLVIGLYGILSADFTRSRSTADRVVGGRDHEEAGSGERDRAFSLSQNQPFEGGTESNIFESGTEFSIDEQEQARGLFGFFEVDASSGVDNAATPREQLGKRSDDSTDLALKSSVNKSNSDAAAGVASLEVPQLEFARSPVTSTVEVPDGGTVLLGGIKRVDVANSQQAGQGQLASSPDPQGNLRYAVPGADGAVPQTANPRPIMGVQLQTITPPAVRDGNETLNLVQDHLSATEKTKYQAAAPGQQDAQAMFRGRGGRGGDNGKFEFTGERSTRRAELQSQIDAKALETATHWKLQQKKPGELIDLYGSKTTTASGGKDGKGAFGLGASAIDPNKPVDAPTGKTRVQVLPEIESILTTGDPTDVDEVKRLIAEIAKQADGDRGDDVEIGANRKAEWLRELSDEVAGEKAVVKYDYYLGELSSRGYLTADQAERLHRELRRHETNEQYEQLPENRFVPVAGESALSTFSIDVDTASYANVRRFIVDQGQLPPPEAVRIEEMVNYFPYDYPSPEGAVPFSANMEVAVCPWEPRHKLLRIGLKGKDVHVDERPETNVVFLLDVSGSMKDENKLPLLKRAMSMLVERLSENDRVSIVTYAGEAGTRLEPTTGDQKTKILGVIDSLSAGGSTHGSAGIQLAYDLAAKNFLAEGVNRVILATDGDLNVGITDDDALVRLIKDRAASGVFLTVLGFGTGNLKDAKLEKLADNGNGNYNYIDSLQEARKVLVQQVSANLVTIAKDVKIQLEFNPAEIRAYRLIGYENRALANEDFADDRVDAGEIGAGHTVTALYELVPTEKAETETETEVTMTPKMKYQQVAAFQQQPLGLTDAAKTGELMTLFIRYKQPDSDESDLLEFPIKDQEARFTDASYDFRFAASVAAFGMIMRRSDYAGDISLDAIVEVASTSLGDDPSGYRTQFVDIARRAAALVK